MVLWTAAILLSWALGLGLSQAAAADDILPNVVADPPAGAMLDASTGRLLLRFDGYVHNIGPGPLEIQGQRTSPSQPMVAYQRVYQTGGGFRDVALPRAQLVYANADGHDHWHLQNVAAYSLWNQARTHEVAPAMKVGFCLDDSEHVDAGVGPPNPVYSDANGRAFCQRNNPDALSVWEGVSAGWRDVYIRSLTFQWVDVSDVQPGVYWLREDADPNGIFLEASSTRAPAYATAPTTISGFDAKPLALASVAVHSPIAITLHAYRYGAPGPERFRVDTAPAHGTLSIQQGSLFTDPNIIYRRNPGYHGPDHFSYVALDSANPYPLHPAEATVSLSVGPPDTAARTQMKALLLAAIIPHGKAASIKALFKKRGYLLSIKTLFAGSATIAWYVVQPGSRNGKPRFVLIARGHLTFAHAGMRNVTLRFTAAGKNLLKNPKVLSVTAKATFTPLGRPPIVAIKRFTLNK